MSPNPKAADFDLFVKGVDPDALQTAVGFLGSVPSAKVPEAEDFILHAAWYFLQATEEEKEAPTRPTFAQKLWETIKTARKLNKLLNSIGEYIYPVGLLYNLLDIESDDRIGMGGSDIERRALAHNPTEIQRRLPLLIVALTLMEENLRERRLDKEIGRGNLYKFLNGPPKWNPLALKCYDLFEDYRPGEAKSTTGGDFYLFYTAIYRVALDADPEGKGVGASHYVEEVCRVYRELAAIQAPLKLIRHALKDPDLPEKNRRELLKDQDENIQRLRAIKRPYPWP